MRAAAAASRAIDASALAWLLAKESRCSLRALIDRVGSARQIVEHSR